MSKYITKDNKNKLFNHLTRFLKENNLYKTICDTNNLITAINYGLDNTQIPIYTLGEVITYILREKLITIDKALNLMKTYNKSYKQEILTSILNQTYTIENNLINDFFIHNNIEKKEILRIYHDTITNIEEEWKQFYQTNTLLGLMEKLRLSKLQHKKYNNRITLRDIQNNFYDYAAMNVNKLF